MRVFVAADLDEEARDFLDRQVGILKAAGARGNYTRRENLHITLRFIGEVRPADIPVLATAVGKACEGMPALRLESSAPGCFGGRPSGGGSLFWYGVKEDAALADLHRLAGCIDHTVAEVGFGRADKPFVAHITLGREVVLAEPFEDYRRRALCVAVAGRNVLLATGEVVARGTVPLAMPQPLAMPLAVQSISLMESRRIRGVLTYLPLWSVRLAADTGAAAESGERS